MTGREGSVLNVVKIVVHVGCSRCPIIEAPLYLLSMLECVLNLHLFCCSGTWKKLTFLSTLSRVMRVSSTALMGVEVWGSEPQR